MSYTDYTLIKKAFSKQEYTRDQVRHLIECSNPETGPLYFALNFFRIQHPIHGEMPFQMFEYQKRLMDVYHNHRLSVNMIFRQGGKTTTAAAYLLWFSMFNDDKTILIAAHKQSGALEIMQRIRYGYELCPDYIRSGVISYNKGSIEFDNGSRIISSATTGNTGRGMSVSCVSVENTIVTVRNIETNEIYKTSIKNIINRDTYKNTKYEIQTTCGFKLFDGFHTSIKDTITLTTESLSIECTEDHLFYSLHRQDWVQAKDLENGEYIRTINIGEKVISKNYCKVQEVVDLLNVHDTHSFIANGIDVHNCLYLDEFAAVRTSIAEEFWASISPTLSTGGKAIITSTPSSDEDQFGKIWADANKIDPETGDQELGVNGFKAFQAYWWEHPEHDDDWKKSEFSRLGSEKFQREYDCSFVSQEETLINPVVLMNLKPSTPIKIENDIHWFKKVSSDYLYLVSLDPSIGSGGDNSCIQVWELPTFEQVAEWCVNKEGIPGQIKKLKHICTILANKCLDANGSNIFWSFENNNIGEAAIITIKDMGEEQIPGLLISEPVRKGKVRKVKKGFNTNFRTKLTACSQFKTLTETGKLKIRSQFLITEMKNFISKGVGYGAKSTGNDDRVSATLLFIRMATVLADWDSSVFETMSAFIDENLEIFEMPMPIIVTG